MENPRPQSVPGVFVPDAENGTMIGIAPAPETQASAPMHTNTQSNLTPTSEFTRLLLLAFPTRYIARAITGFKFAGRPGPQNMTYGLIMGIGSAVLSLKYGALVRQDIKNIFSEAVAMEKGITPEQITFKDIKNSDNRVIQGTIKTYRSRMWKRLGTDALFFLTAPLAMSEHKLMQHPDAKQAPTDAMVGIKGAMALGETWNRKTTMFEDLVTFITNKINPRNGLGQPVTMGELFDLYQHYSETHQPDKMFRTVLSRDTSQSQLHAINQPVFTRMTELMNLTYAYKHGNASQTAVSGADFALPKFIYLLGHDLIDPSQPERTLALVEVMNAHGVAGVKQAQALMQQGVSPAQLLQQLGLQAPQQNAEAVPDDKNAVIAKGSTMQLDAAPDSTVDKASISTAQLSREAALGV